MKLLQAYLEVSMVSVILITAAFTLFTLSGGKIPARYRKRVWLLLAIQLLIPFRYALPNAPVSVPAPDLSATLPLLSFSGGMPLPSIPSNAMMRPQAQGISLLAAGTILWIVGMAGYGAFQLGGYFHARRRMMRWSTPVTDEGLTGMLTQLRQALGIKRNVALRQSRDIHSPLLMGWFRPIIVLPAHCAVDDELRLILYHELFHHKNGDIPYKLVMLIARTIHWFNPIAHLMTRQAEVDMEFACDDAVIRAVGAGSRIAYGEAILSAAGGFLRHGSAFTTHFYPGKKNLIERMKNVMNHNIRGAGMLITAVFLVLFVACGLLVSFANATEDTADTAPGIDPGYVQERFGLLLGLRFPGYENMTLSDFREAALQAMDAPETFEAYNVEIDSDDAYLWDYRYVDADASFIRNTLTPLIAQKWETFEYPNWVQNPATKGSALEYRLSRTLLAPERMTVGAYQKAIFGIMDDITVMTLSHCDGGAVDEAAVRLGLVTLSEKHSNDMIQFAVKDIYVTEWDDVITQETEHAEVIEEAWEETEQFEEATDADYALVLALRYDGYQTSTAADFTAYVANAFSGDEAPIHGAYERVMMSTTYGSAPQSITEEDLQFLRSLEISVREFVATHQSQYAEETIYPTFTGYYFNEEDSAYGIAIEYAFEVEMVRGGAVTVEARDGRIGAVLSAMQAYLEGRSDADWADGEAAFLAFFEESCAASSDANMTCTPSKTYYAVNPQAGMLDEGEG